ncbi:MAG: CofH family radical SAM protein [Prevotellaceae bacterium]|jgi:cyclic dehypoxanthinyl futalosine synthase|nr:CofH family radical SAM protein [Prevotellaceae bacterium]
MHIPDRIFSKALKLKPLSADELMLLYRFAPTNELMFTANQLRQMYVRGKGVSWQIDRNVNITNVCISGCKFCSFHCKPHETQKSYTTTFDEYIDKIEELKKLDGNQLLLQGGLHPDYGLQFYVNLFSELKKYYPDIKLHALGPPEIAHIAQKEQKSFTEILEKLIEAGLDSLPGAGAEILCDRIRKQISPAKPDAQTWLDVMHEAHKLNLPTSATMVFGHIETLEERIEHLIKIRNLQYKKPRNAYGFLAFICWPVQLCGTKLGEQIGNKITTAEDYIRTVAISRIALTNIKNIQASWLTTGKNIAQIALHSGANDMGSIMIEENVVAATGTVNTLDADGIQQAICEAGFTPWRRNQKYQRE